MNNEIETKVLLSSSQFKNYSQLFMAGQKSKQRSSSSDPNFDLDDYLEKKGSHEADDELYDEAPKNNNFLNRALLLIALVSAVVWSFNLTQNTDWASLFGFGNSEANSEPIVVNIPPINIDIPEIDIDIPEFSTNTNSNELGSAIEYLQELQSLGLLDAKISAFEARQLYGAGVPINYLTELDQRGYLEDLSFVEIGEFYKNNIPFDYLAQLDQLGFLDRFSFVEIGEFYKNEVSFEYLEVLDQAGYLDELSFVYITEYYKNGVTVEFLDELKETGLYNSLNFIDVVELYKNQN